MGHSESQKIENLQKLLQLGVHTTCIAVLNGPSGSDVVKGAAGGVLQNLAMADAACVDALVESGCVPALTRRLARTVHALGREGACDALLNLTVSIASPRLPHLD